MPNQRDKMVPRAISMGFHIGPDDIFLEHGVSGANDDRPEYNRMLAAITQGKYKALFTYDISRLTRTESKVEQDRIIKTLVAAGCDLYTDGTHYDLRNPQSRFMFGINANVAEYDNAIRAQKSKEGRETARARGKNPGQAPATGYTKFYKPDGALIYRLDESAIAPVKIAYQMALEGAGATRIRRVLHEKGYRTKTGSPLSITHVYQWLKNPTYAGYVHVGMARGSKAKEKGMWPAEFLEGRLVNLQEWERVQELLKSRASRKSTNRYPLSGILRCPSCGGGLTGQYKRGWKGQESVRYYSCIPTGQEIERLCPNTQGRSIKMSIAHKLVMEALEEIMGFIGENYDAAIEQARQGKQAGGAPDLKKELLKIERKIMQNVRENEDNPSEYYRKRIKELSQEAEQIKKTIREQERATLMPDMPSLEEIKEAARFIDPSSAELLDDISSVLFTKLHYSRTGTHRKYTFSLVSLEFKWGQILRLERPPSYSQ